MKAEWKSCTGPALVALVIGCWSTLAAAQSTTPQPAACNPCTEPNGRGIYISEGVNYCVDFNDMRFCPEAFVQESAQGVPPVQLAGRLFRKNKIPFESWQKYPVTATLGNGDPVTLTGFKVQGAHLSLLYKSPSNSVTEVDLSELTLATSQNILPEWARLPELGRLKLRFKKEDHGYTGQWIAHNSTRAFCPDNPLMSLLPGKKVDGRSGKVTGESRMVTMACATGAIAICMDWGYNPSALDSTATTENALLGACIQAKRAAYFLSSGDTEGYTKSGKTIDMKDHLKTLAYPKGVRGGDQEIPSSSLEAVWTENGAMCLNENNRRVDDNDPPLPNNWQEKLQGCPEPLPELWSGPEYIFTGKVAQP